jgi:hypothetical protein
MIPTVRAMAWLSAAALTFLTLASPHFRPSTPLAHPYEHLLAFAVSGVLFGVGYRARSLLVLSAGVVFAIMLEVLQIWVPGRHARWIDVAMDAGGFCLGLGVALLLSRFMIDPSARRLRAVAERRPDDL